MILIHRGKTTENVIPLDGDKALHPSSFATYTEKPGAGDIRHVSLGWTLHSTQQGEDGKRAKYQDNIFELRVEAQEIDAAIHALKVAKERFTSPEVPGLAKPEVKEEVEAKPEKKARKKRAKKAPSDVQ